jgi:ABC-type antimicrobial peptide transport system permease subunit
LNALPGVIGVEDWRQTIRDIQRAADFNGNFGYIFLGFGMLLTFVVLYTTVSVGVHERQTELAIMRMQGMSLGEIRLMALLETLVAAVVGLLIGILPAAGLLDFIGQSYNTDVAGNVIVIYPQTWVLAVVTLIIITLVSLLLPLRSVSRANLGDVSKSVGA